MSNATAAPVKKGFGFLKAALGGGVGLATGVIGVYATAIVDMVAKPPKPVANFRVTADGLTITCQNRASGQSGWWDFGDGSPLEPFTPDQSDVEHTYAKPGGYDVKLIVRNFLNEENERTVPVDVAIPAAGTSGGPTIVGLTVEPVGSTTAPATFRVKCELKNAQQTIIDLGNNDRPEMLTANGVFEKLVVYERPGTYPLQVYAVSGAKLDKQWKQVDVAPPSPGMLAVVAKVTDTGFKFERKTSTQLVPVTVPAKPTGKFERGFHADPGCVFASVKLAPYTSKAVKGVAVELAPDKKTAKVVGEWTGSVEATNRAAGGSDLMIPVLVEQEKTVPLAGNVQSIPAQLAPSSLFDPKAADGQRSATLNLPTQPAGVGVKRTVTLTVLESNPQGRMVELATVPDLSKPADEVAVTLNNKQRVAVRWERTANGQLRVSTRPVAVR